MNIRQDAQRYLDQLRAQTHAALGTFPAPPDPVSAREIANWIQRNYISLEEPQRRALELLVANSEHRGFDDMITGFLARMQDDIERTIAADSGGMELQHRRPLVGHLQTGQLNAVSLRVPGSSDAHLVVFEDQMSRFCSMLSQAVAGVLPCHPVDANGVTAFHFDLPAVIERIQANPEVADPFIDRVVTYAVTGSLNGSGRHLPSPDYGRLATILHMSVVYFVLGHEYGHILLGHLDRAATRKGVLPATEAEVLAYSWQQEFDADLDGLTTSINTGVEQRNFDISFGFLGISLFFDALDVMDRAVALLQTGDEDTRQLGSHPPSHFRKQHLCNSLSKTAERDPVIAESIRVALDRAEVQGEIICLLWERTRPILLDLRRQGVSAAHSWRTTPKETSNESAPRA